jgi:hypothetical protein
VRSAARPANRTHPATQLSYFTESLPALAGWDQVPAAYLAFGDTYAAERGEAARRGWPVNTLAGAHLHQLIDPAVAAAEITTLIGRCGIDPLNQQCQRET